MPAPHDTVGSFRSVAWIAGVLFAVILLLSLGLSLFLPPGELRERRDARRQEDLTTLLDALSRFAAEEGSYPAGMQAGTSREICNVTLSSRECAAENGVDLSPLIGTYLPVLPRDPLLPSTGTGTQYALRRNADGSITATAWMAENSNFLEITR
ncbi:MAG: hypothetical protein WCV62_03140 [Candidatus Peribacteraceae bacterium]|jgi:hypothetical protein